MLNIFTNISTLEWGSKIIRNSSVVAIKSSSTITSQFSGRKGCRARKISGYVNILERKLGRNSEVRKLENE